MSTGRRSSSSIDTPRVSSTDSQAWPARGNRLDGDRGIDTRSAEYFLTAALPRTSKVQGSIAPIRLADLKLRSCEFQIADRPRQSIEMFLFIVSFHDPYSEIQNPKSTIRNHLDHLIRPEQHRLRNRQTNLLGGFKIDHELKLLRLLDWNIGWLCSFKNLINQH